MIGENIFQSVFAEFLLPSLDMKRADQQKPYDPKASVWIKDEKTHGYKEGLLVTGDINLENPAEKVVVAVGNRIKLSHAFQSFILPINLSIQRTKSST